MKTCHHPRLPSLSEFCAKLGLSHKQETGAFFSALLPMHQTKTIKYGFQLEFIKIKPQC